MNAAQKNPILAAPATFVGITDTAVETIRKYRSGELDPQYYGNYTGTLAAVADTMRMAANMIAELK